MSTHTATSTILPGLSLPRLLLHAEGAALLGAAAVLYGQQDFSWGVFALFLLAPDLAMIAYAANDRIGSLVYNLVHTTVFPLALGLFSLATGSDTGIQVSLIWLAHIGMDRLFGYGFKYPGGFKETHFGRI